MGGMALSSNKLRKTGPPPVKASAAAEVKRRTSSESLGSGGSIAGGVKKRKGSTGPAKVWGLSGVGACGLVTC